ncbi:MAG: GNAT family N-acetyltransferase, partial [Nanoarchaeota archaeon]
MRFSIRKAKLSDSESVADLYLQFWKSHERIDPLLEFENKLTLDNQIEFAKKNIKKTSNNIFVADLNGKVIGFIEFLIKKNENCFKIKEYGYLNLATTDKGHRGKGVAKALTNTALQFLKDRGVKYVRTNVYNSNDIAMKTWTKIGFEPQSTFLIK